jgi:hypothetical protein
MLPCLLRYAGEKHKPAVFLFSDSQIVEETMVRMHEGVWLTRFEQTQKPLTPAAYARVYGVLVVEAR